MTVLEVVREYHLELVDKIYKDENGLVHSINLRTLSGLRVKDFKLKLDKNQAIITVYDIDLYDKKEER